MSVFKTQALPAHRRYAAPVEAIDRMNRSEDLTAAELFELYLEDVFRYVLQRAQGVEEAKDITSEVFVAAAAGLSRFRGHCAPRVWLLSIARRQTALAQRRRKARRETLASELAEESAAAEAAWEELAEVEGPEAALMRAEARRVVRDLVAQLNPDQREALLLQYVERLSVAEIAVVMGRSPAAVTGLLQRARAALRRQGRGYFLGTEEGKVE
jgi:RNA polymerase sigma-70 factor (ECF subfamily)